MRSPEAVASASGSAAETVLTDEMLARFAKRAPQYDRDNAFFVDDFDELRQAGYLRVAIPPELGGQGLSLAGVAQQQRRLGYYAAPTALAINMFSIEVRCRYQCSTAAARSGVVTSRLVTTNE